MEKLEKKLDKYAKELERQEPNQPKIDQAKTEVVDLMNKLNLTIKEMELLLNDSTEINENRKNLLEGKMDELKESMSAALEDNNLVGLARAYKENSSEENKVALAQEMAKQDIDAKGLNKMLGKIEQTIDANGTVIKTKETLIEGERLTSLEQQHTIEKNNQVEEKNRLEAQKSGRVKRGLIILAVAVTSAALAAIGIVLVAGAIAAFGSGYAAPLGIALLGGAVVAFGGIAAGRYPAP